MTFFAQKKYMTFFSLGLLMVRVARFENSAEGTVQRTTPWAERKPRQGGEISGPR